MGNIYLPEGLCRTRERYTLKELERAMREGEILEARAVHCNAERNLYVDLGCCMGIIAPQEALYDAAQRPVKDIALITRVGKYVSFVVTDISCDDDGQNRVLLSRRLAQKNCCNDYIRHLECGDIIDAVVTHMEPFGAFCDIGCGVTALLPIDCISVSRISHPRERFTNGQKIRCVVKSIEKDICRVTLTHKELLGTWQENADLFSAGDTVMGIVRSVEPYGIFVELSPNLAGLAEYCEGPEAGDTAAVYIKSIIPEKMKMKLVIVDTSPVGCERRQQDSEYFVEGNHMDEWRYSPEGCSKEIFTIFGG